MFDVECPADFGGAFVIPGLPRTGSGLVASVLDVKKFFGLSVAPLLMFALVACSGGADVSESNLFEKVTAAQTAAKSVTTEMKMGAPEGKGEALQMAGVMRMDSDPKKTAFDTTMGTAEMPMRMIMIDGFMYINMGAMTKEKFLKIDPNDPDSPLAEQFDSVTENTDPTAQLKQLEKAVTSIKKVGDGGKVDGVNTTKFKVLVDPSKLPDTEGAAGMPESLEYFMWVGDDNLMRRMEMDVDGATFSVLWSKWGEPVTIEVPAKGEIVEDIPGMTAPKA